MLIKIMVFQWASFNNIKFVLRNCYQLLWVAKISYIKYDGYQLIVVLHFLSRRYVLLPLAILYRI